MQFDPYSPCPGGTGKKVKFCCPDLVGEWEKITRMIEGDQRAACLEHIDRLTAKHPDRACLLSVKASLESALGHNDKADATLAAYMEKYPDNPVALSELAVQKLVQEGPLPAIEPLQRALAACEHELPRQIYDAILAVAEALLTEGNILAARGHLLLTMAITGPDDEQATRMLVALNGSPQIPLLLKQDVPLEPAPADALWKRSFDGIIEEAQRGDWIYATTQLRELARKVGDWPLIWRTLATLRGFLGDMPGTVEALRMFAAQNVPFDDAVEAEATAQLIDEEGLDQLEVLSITYPVLDQEKLQSRLASQPRAQRMPIDLARLAGENEPPPKGAYWLLDRPVPRTGAGLTRDQASNVVGQAFWFGRQTDREARLELVTYRTDELREATSALAEVAGDAVGPAAPEQITMHVPAVQHALSWNWRLPDDTPRDLRLALIAERRRDALLNQWPKLPQKIFGGRSAEQVARDPAYRIKLAAAILLLEQSADPTAGQFDFNELRGKLDVPALGPIDPTAITVARLPLARLARIEVAKLSDDDLVLLYRRSGHYRSVEALRKLATEGLNRPSLERDKKIDRAEVCGALAQTETDPDRALGYLEQARQAAEAAGKSTAPWDLSELAMRISRGEIQDADRLLHHIRNEHMREPGVAQALMQILVDAGILRPDGTPAGPPQREAPGIVVPGAAAVAAEPGKIWTPGGAEPSGAKSKIWTPE